MFLIHFNNLRELLISSSKIKNWLNRKMSYKLKNVTWSLVCRTNIQFYINQINFHEMWINATNLCFTPGNFVIVKICNFFETQVKLFFIAFHYCYFSTIPTNAAYSLILDWHLLLMTYGGKVTVIKLQRGSKIDLLSKI